MADQYNIAGPGSTQITTQHGDVTVTNAAPVYRLEPFSSAPVVDWDQLAAQPSRLLDARSQIVPFGGREDELAQLARWRDSDAAAVSALLLHGPGGQGKSRLAARFAELSADAGWEVAQARHGAAPQRPEGDLAQPGPGGLLVIVDYADRWAHPELVELLRDPRLAGPAVRVLLIGRTVQWWAALRGELRSVGAAVSDLRLDEFAESAPDRERAFVTARDRFGVVLGVSEPITELARGLDSPAYGQVLTVHMAALVAALTARYPGSSMPDSVEGIAAYLLDRERMGWRRLYGSRLQGEEFDTSPTTMARAVFAAILGGAVSYSRGVARLDRVRLAPADRILTDHRFCYPPQDRAQVLEPLYPDRLAEDFVALLLPEHHITGYDPDPWATDVPRTLLGLDDPDAPVPSTVDRTVTVLASAADRWPHVGEQLGALLRERPDIAVHAGSAALVALGEAQHVDTDVLLAVEVHFPTQRQVDLDAGTAAVTDRLVRDRVDDTTRLQDAASWYSRLGMRLAHAGRKEEAIRANHKALAALSRLDELDPRTYGVEVAVCTMDIGGYLSDLGRHREAVGFTGRATELLRAGAAEHPQDYLPSLALALSNYGNQLQNIGQRHRAVEAAHESVAIHRAVAGTDLAAPARFAFALTGLGTRLMAVGQDHAALAALAESVDTYRGLVETAPQTHLPSLARALTNLGTAHQRLGHRAEALRFTEEAVTIRRRLASLVPDAYTADLTLSLVNYAGRLSDVGRHDPAIGAATEAVGLARRLVRGDHAAHQAVLAHALANHGAALANTDRDSAVASLREAVALYERLMLVDDGYRSALETTLGNLRVLGAAAAPSAPAMADAEVVDLFNLGVRLVQGGRTTEAEECYRRAAEAGLPQAMFNLGNLCAELGRIADAEAWLTNAVTAGMVVGCHNLGVLHWNQGDRDKARHWFRRGADAGAANAMVSLGVISWDDGDRAEAEHWFRTAADAGDPDGGYRLGLLLAEQGRHPEAQSCFEHAAEAGHPEAMRALADHHMRHNRVGDAQQWWRIAHARTGPAPQPPPGPAPQPSHPLVDADREVPVLSFTPDQSVALAAELLARRVANLVQAGRHEEAVEACREDAAAHERMLHASREQQFPLSPNMVYSLMRQGAVTLASMAGLELALGRTEDALAHSEEAANTLGALAARTGDAVTHASAQRVFAAIRAAIGTDIERATTAITEAITTFSRLAPDLEDEHHHAVITLADLLDHAGRHDEADRLRDTM